MLTHYILQTERNLNYVRTFRGTTDKETTFINDLAKQYERQLEKLKEGAKK